MSTPAHMYRLSVWMVWAWLCWLPVASCTPPEQKAPAPEPAEEKGKRPAADRAFDKTGKVPSSRVVSFGDVHGDLDVARQALRLAGAIDDRDRWIGGSLTVVQTGDALDRGDQDKGVMDLFAELSVRAKAEGGAFIQLNGNHEIMNVYGELRYVSPKSARAFDTLEGLDLQHARLALVPAVLKRRAAAFLPGGPYAAMLARNDITVQVGDTLYVHGGILPWHVTYGLDRINREARLWMAGEIPRAPRVLTTPQGPTWSREYSLEPGGQACDKLDQVLEAVGAKRMVVGHQVQRHGISTACDERIWRIDVGMSRYYNGPLEILEILAGDRVSVKRPAAPGRAPL